MNADTKPPKKRPSRAKKAPAAKAPPAAPGTYQMDPGADAIFERYQGLGTDPIYCQIELLDYYAPRLDTLATQCAGRTLDVLHTMLAGRPRYWDTFRPVAA